MGFLDYPVKLGFWEQGIDVKKVADKLFLDLGKRHTSFENAQKRRVDKKLAQARRLQTEYRKRKQRWEKATDGEEKAAAKIAFDQTKQAVQTVIAELKSPEGYVNKLFKKETLSEDIEKLQQSVTNQENFLKDQDNKRETLKNKLKTKVETAYNIVNNILRNDPKTKSN